MAEPEYDDLFPVSYYQSNVAQFLLDRHNDLIATFDCVRDRAECERVVEACNQFSALRVEVETLRQEIDKLKSALAEGGLGCV